MADNRTTGALCGCTIVETGGFYSIEFCPKCKAVPELYEAIKSRQHYEHVRHEYSLGLGSGWKARLLRKVGFWRRYERLIIAKERAALALADGGSA